MTTQVSIARISDLKDEEIQPLVDEAHRQGFDFVQRLLTDFRSGANRFDKVGEALFGAYDDGRLIGVGGLNCDPYLNDESIGRVRHVYVLSAYRRRRVATALMDRIIREAHGQFRLLTLRTRTQEASAFYESLGFAPTTEIPNATHYLRLWKNSDVCEMSEF
jgi:GNAT superfamily N-acetyltransferase